MTDITLGIYAPVITPRLEYVAEVLFSAILGVDYEIVSDLQKTHISPHIAYSEENIAGALHVHPSGLLTDTGITPVVPSVTWIGEVPVFFQSEKAGSFPFDLFSAAFYMLSRYEEYLPFRPDSHGRFVGSNSLAYRAGFLKMPVVDMWASMISEVLIKRYPGLQFRKNEYRSLITIDVDQAYAFKGRGFLRSVGGFVKDFSGPESHAGSRLKAITGFEKDPYDLFDYIEEQVDENNADAHFFFPVGNPGDHDHNTLYGDGNYKALIKRMQSRYGCGLHSSYRSFGRADVLSVETGRFSEITGEAPEKCRQHWLLLRMPSTYRSFINAGIKEDYTMGFADEPGFRAGIARPFRFYDLEEEKSTDLTVIPFQFMDGTLRQYKNMNPEMALKEIGELIEVTKKTGGLFVSLWHNTSVAEMNGWEGWRRVFEETLRMQKQ